MSNLLRIIFLFNTIATPPSFFFKRCYQIASAYITITGIINVIPNLYIILFAHI